MKAISIGKRFEIFDDSLKTYNCLPAKNYMVRFSQMTGFYLEEFSEIDIKEEKVYGVHVKKVEKVLRTFNEFKRSLGVILSGDKGIGKSLFAKMVSIEAVKRGMPVIIVDSFIPGIESYIESIEQEVVVMFDEFDKTFASYTGDNGKNPQTGLLTLFDGISQGKKLFIITCNELNGLNNYLINRPGRFHYHFRFDYPTPEETREYLMDKLQQQFYNEIPKVVAFSNKVNLNYDCLRAIAYELNHGEKFEQVIQDLNILNMNEERYSLMLYFNDGQVSTLKNKILDVFNNDMNVFFFEREDRDFRVSFVPSDFVYDATRNVSTLTPDKFHYKCVDSFGNDVNDEDKNENEDTIHPVLLTIVKSKGKNLHYVF